MIPHVTRGDLATVAFDRYEIQPDCQVHSIVGSVDRPYRVRFTTPDGVPFIACPSVVSSQGRQAGPRVWVQVAAKLRAERLCAVGDDSDWWDSPFAEQALAILYRVGSRRICIQALAEMRCCNMTAMEIIQFGA